MNSHLDDLIDRLADDLKPVRLLRASRLWFGAFIGLMTATAFVFFVYSFRPEVIALSKGVLPSHFTPIGKPLLFFTLGVTALSAVSRLNRPESEIKLLQIFPIFGGSGIAIVNMGFQLATKGWNASARQLNENVLSCFATIWVGGSLGMFVLWKYWLRQGATSFPRAMAAMSGLATASLMASAYALHCTMDAPVYIVLVYGVAVTVFTGTVALFGGNLLRLR